MTTPKRPATGYVSPKADKNNKPAAKKPAGKLSQRLKVGTLTQAVTGK